MTIAMERAAKVVQVVKAAMTWTYWSTATLAPSIISTHAGLFLHDASIKHP